MVCVALFFLTDELYAWICWHFYSCSSDCFGRAQDSSYRPTVFYLGISAELVLFSKLHYCIPA
jgi:hypothetical protein